jgi:ribose transport system permease protein
VAVYVIGVGITGLQQLGAESYAQDLFNGAALLIALIISTIARRAEPLPAASSTHDTADR